jgi:hypothetical protein
MPALHALAFSLAWTQNLTAPFEPMSIGLSATLGVVQVGGRDCPDNTRNEVFSYGLEEGRQVLGGSKGAVSAAVSQLAMGQRAPDAADAFAGLGWDKPHSQTLLQGPRGYNVTFPGEPAYGVPSAISADGTHSAYLFERKPDEKHLNNRSGTLSLVGSQGEPVYHYSVSGQGSFDPQSVSMSADGSIVAALFGSKNVVLDWASKSIVWENAGQQTAVAVSGQGSFFSITSGFGGTTVDVYSIVAGTAKKLTTIKPPASNVGVYQPMVMAFGANLLGVVWQDQDGTMLTLTAHDVSTTSVKQLWSYESTCPDGGSFNYVMQVCEHCPPCVC